MHTNKLEHENLCPRCKTNLDAASSKEKITPKPGDLSVCFYCAAVLQFNNELKSEILSSEEFNNLPEQIKAQILLITNQIKGSGYYDKVRFDA